MLPKILNIVSLITFTCGGLAILFPWKNVLCRFQLYNNESSRKTAIVSIEKSERQYQKVIIGKKIINNFYLVGSLFGMFKIHALNVAAFDKMHRRKG